MILNWKYQRLVYMYILAVHDTVMSFDCSNEKVYSKVFFKKRGKKSVWTTKSEIICSLTASWHPKKHARGAGENLMRPDGWHLFPWISDKIEFPESPHLKYYTICSYNSLNCCSYRAWSEGDWKGQEGKRPLKPENKKD